MRAKHLRTWPAAVLALVLAICLAAAPVQAAAPASAVSAGVSAEDVRIVPGSYALGGFLPAPAAQTLATDPAVTLVTGNYGQTEARRMLSLINSFRAGEISTEGQKVDPCGSGRYAWQWNSDDATTTTYAPGALNGLTYDYGLEKVAMQRAAEIAVSFSHTRPDGSLCFDLEIDGVSSSGENIAYGRYAYETQESVFVAWREDDRDYSGQGHRRNMLRPNFDAVGVGFFSVGERHYWVQEFGWSNSGKPATDPDDAAAAVLVDYDRAVFPGIVPLERPFITGQPEDYTGRVGTTATFSVTAEGDGLSYQWQYSRDGSTWTNSPAAGNKTAVLSIPVTENRNGMHYRCIVSDTDGNSNISAVATLIVIMGIPDAEFSHSCSFGNDLSIIYYVTGVPEIDTGEIALVVEQDVWNREGTKKSVKTTVITEYQTDVYQGETEYRFVYTGIAAKGMGDELRARLVVNGTADGTVVNAESAADIYSARTYCCNRIANSTDPYFRTMLVDLLNYGAQAQTYFGYRLNALVNADLTAEQQALGTQTDVTSEGVPEPSVVELSGTPMAAFTGKTAAFGNTIELKYYFELAEGVDPADVRLNVKFTTVDNKVKYAMLAVNEEKYDPAYNEYSLLIRDIAAKDMGQQAAAYFADRSGRKVSDTLYYSLENYFFSRLEKSPDESFKVLIRQVLKFSRSARAYFESQQH